MSNKIVLMLILLVAGVFISGCTDKDNGTNQSVKPELIPTTNLPAGFIYMGTHEISVNISGTSMNATEGVYRNNGEDAYIQVIENNNPEAFLSLYKEQLKKEFKSGFNPFQEISLNGHKATQVTDYSTVNGQQKPNYAVIWTTGKAMISVASPTADLQTVLALATATKS